MEKLMNRHLAKLGDLGLILLVGAVIHYSIADLWNAWNLGLAIAGGTLLLAGIVINRRRILHSLGRRSTKYATNYVISVALVLGLAAAFNFIGQRHPKRFDLTAGGHYTLAPQTVQILDRLDRDVEIKAFYPDGDDATLRELLVQFRTLSSHIEYEFIDPDRYPDVARQNDVTVYGTFANPFTGTQLKSGTTVVRQGDLREKIEKRSDVIREEDLTNALIKVQRAEKKRVYFVAGHGEKEIGSSDRSGYSEVQKALENQGFATESVNLAGEGKVPEDAQVLVIAGATIEPFPQESEYLSEFLNQGGGVLLMIDPPPAASLQGFLNQWGVVAGENIVLDVSGAGRLMGAGPEIPLVLEYESHEITERFRSMTFFPLVRSVEPSEQTVDGVTVTPLLQSNPRSWGETDLGEAEKSFDEGEDSEGPLPLAVAVSKQLEAVADPVETEPDSTKEGTEEADSPAPATARMVVVGDSEFASNAHFLAQGNGNLFLNMISWLAQEKDLISIRPKSPEDRRITLSQSQQTTLFYLTVVLLPLGVIVAGISVWSQRRN